MSNHNTSEISQAKTYFGELPDFIYRPSTHEKNEAMKWVQWNMEKPKVKGYYLFAFHAGGEFSDKYTYMEVDLFDPKDLTAGVCSREIERINHHFLNILAWTPLPDFPYNLIVYEMKKQE